MLDGKLDTTIQFRLFSIASAVSEYFYDFGEGERFLRHFEECFDIASSNPDACIEYSRGLKRFNFYYRGFDCYALFICVDELIYVTDIFHKNQNVWLP